MGQYGQAALYAIKDEKSRQANTPSGAWYQATCSFLTSSQGKPCTKSAFLGLCPDGYVRGVISGHYTQSLINKWYAIKAADILKADPSLISLGELGLWKKVMRAVGEPTGKTPNQQIDAVLTLFQNRRLIQRLNYVVN